MPIYEVHSKLASGRLKKEMIDAVDEEAAKAVVRSRNQYPVMVRSTDKNIEFPLFNSVKIKDIAVFCRQFSYILMSGMNILKALEILKEQSTSKKLSTAIKNMYMDVQKGKGLSASMKKQNIFPEMLVNMIQVGEVGGNLDEIMLKMSDYYDKQFAQRQKVKQALAYPIIVVIFAIIIVNFLVICILPKMISGLIDSQTKLPLPTRIVIGFSHFMTSYWYIILACIVILVILAKTISKGDRSIKFDSYKLRIPIFGKINLKVASANFARTFGMLLGSGLPLLESIEISGKALQNSFIESQLSEAAESIKKGLTLSSYFEDKKMFTPMLTQMIKVGEESGTIDSILSKTSEYYDEEVETATNQMTTMIEPVIIIVLAAVVCFIILSFILPVFQMYDSY